MTPLEIIIAIIAIIIVFYVAYQLGRKLGRVTSEKEWQKMIPKIREDATKRSRAVIGGKISEKLAPFLPDFPWKPTESKFLGKPVDFLVFKGLDKKQIEEIIFVEVKSGSSRLNTSEKSLRDALMAKKVSWEEYRIPEKLTKQP